MDLPAEQSGQRATPPALIVGRSAERTLLHEQLEEAMRGHGRLAIIGGEVGIGKTTLARDLARAANERGVLALAGYCYDLTATPPYGPWLDLAARYRPADGLPPFPPALASGDIGQITDQAAFFGEVRAFFVALTTLHPALVILEDLHWADPASVDLLRYLAARLSSMPLMLLVTYRVDELTRRHPFYQQLPALTRESDGLRIDLKRLGADDVRELITARFALPADDRERLVAYLVAHAEGNPFFVVELLRALEEERLLRRAEDRWALAALDRMVVPPLARQVIDGRVARLGESMREPLAIAAVIGQEVPLALWAEVAGLDDETLMTIAERAVEARLLDATPDGTRVQFVHALTRETLYESVPPPRRRIWHRRVGDALAARPSPNPNAVAYHFQQAGDPRASEWLTRAGERAQRAYAWLTAVERFAAAARLLEDVPGAEEDRAWLLYRCGRLRRYTDTAQGIAELNEAARLAEAAGLTVLAADAIYFQGVLRCFGGDFRTGLKLKATGIDVLEALPLVEARQSWTTVTLLADALPAIELGRAPEIEPAAEALTAAGMSHRRGSLTWYSAAAGRLADAQANGERFAAAVAGVSAGPLVLSATGHVFFGLAMVHAARGAPDEACRAFEAARQIYRRLDHHAPIAYTYLTELHDVILAYRAIDIAERRRVAGEAQAALERAGGALPSGLSPRRAWLSVHYLEGRWEEAREIAGDTAMHGTYLMRREVTDALALIAYHQGRTDDAWDQVRSLLPEGPATEPGSRCHISGLLLQRLAADLALDAGRPEEARAWLEANDRWLAWSGSVLGRAENRTAWARFYRVNGDLVRAVTMADQAVRAATDLHQPLALLTARRLRGEVATALGKTTTAEQELKTALALAEACAAPFERALTLIAMAELRAATGQPGEAIGFLADARMICEPLDARPTLPRIDALSTRLAGGLSDTVAPFGLTRREWEILRHLVEDCTNREIADALFVSPRTVTTHVQHIFAKLGVSNRRAAASFAIKHNLVSPRSGSGGD